MKLSISPFKKKRFLIPLLIIIIGLVLVDFHYQQVINEGSTLADEHCLNINPLIINRKNRYLDTLRVVQASGSAEKYKEANDNYIVASQVYLTNEANWMQKQTEFINRWDFKLMTPKVTQELAAVQLDGYMSDYASTWNILKLFDEKDPAKQKELEDEISLANQRSTQDEDAYNKIWDTHKPGFDLRNYITSVPKSKCPAKNFDFPNVYEEMQKIFAPQAPIENSGITG